MTLGGYWIAVVVAVVGLVVLLAFLVTALGRLRRLERAAQAMRAALDRGTAPLTVELTALKAARTGPDR